MTINEVNKEEINKVLLYIQQQIEAIKKQLKENK